MALPHPVNMLPENYRVAVIRCLTSLQIIEQLLAVYLSDELKLTDYRGGKFDPRRNYYRRYGTKRIKSNLKDLRKLPNTARLAGDIEKIMVRRNYIAHQSLAEGYWNAQRKEWRKAKLEEIRRLDRSAYGCWKRLIKRIVTVHVELRPHRPSREITVYPAGRAIQTKSPARS